MRDTDFYVRVLGLETPWRVGRVDLDVDQKRVDIHLTHDPGLT